MTEKLILRNKSTNMILFLQIFQIKKPPIKRAFSKTTKRSRGKNRRRDANLTTLSIFPKVSQIFSYFIGIAMVPLKVGRGQPVVGVVEITDSFSLFMGRKYQVSATRMHLRYFLHSSTGISIDVLKMVEGYPDKPIVSRNPFGQPIQEWEQIF